jgi:hypothetical protein
MDVLCPFCRAYHWRGEKVSNCSSRVPEFTACCQRGRVRLPFLTPPPPFLRGILESDDARGIEFRTNIRRYNMALAFTSLGVKEDKRVNRVNHGRRGWVFRVEGELCHLIGALRPDEGVPPSYAQLYIYDSQLALQQRMNRNDDLCHDTMSSLQSMLLEHHRYSKDFKHAYEILQDYPDVSDAVVRLRTTPGKAPQQYNLPTSDEVAVILPGDGTSPDRRDIILRRRSGEYRLTRIDDGHPAYSPLHYVVLFPHGDNGWHKDLHQCPPPKSNILSNSNPPRITQTLYSAFRLHIHDGEYPTIHRGGRLFQQYVVDMWASADQTRLSYLRTSQAELRATLYNGLEDLMSGEEIGNPKDVGQRVVLPSSYIGGPRHQQQRYQDAMTIARFFKKIDLFITMTANPNWEEITRELLPGQTSYDRPDLIARVFKQKKQELMDDIYKKQIFGHVPAYIYVVEFQKRGLPHVHLLIVLGGDSRLRTPRDVDSCISAQWPDPDVQPMLFDTVRSTMIHGPCGSINPSAVCMENGQCTKGYPKAFQHETSTADDGYPLYARPDDGRSFPVKVKGTTVHIDNQWIVPYNPYLSAKFHCHINVESVATFRTVKYCFKYIHKGPDRATLEYEHDEIKQYIDGRYIGAPEAIWRILHFDVHKQIPTVERLQVCT